MNGEMDPVAALRAASTATTPAASSPDKTAPSTKDFASYLKDGEKLAKVPDHSGYEEIDGGKRDGEFLNTSGNKRTGEAFKIETVHGRILHVYGDLRIVVGKATDSAKTTDAASKSTGAASGGVSAPDDGQSSSTPSSSSSSSS
jgi:hypothetical protein